MMSSLAALHKGINGSNYTRSAYESTYVIWAKRGFPVALGSDKPVVVAVQLASSSRLVAFGHEGIISGCCATNDARDKMVLNSVIWLSGQDPEASATVRIAALSSYSAGLANIKQALESTTQLSVTTSVLNLDSLAAGNWAAIDIIWIDTYFQYNETQIRGVLKFANQTGKGVLVGGHAWNWGSSHPGANIFTDLPINKILWPLGVLVTTDWQVGFAATPSAPPREWYYYNSYVAAATVYNVLTGDALDPALLPLILKVLNNLLSILPPASQAEATGTTATWDLLDKLDAAGGVPPAVGPLKPFNTTSASLGKWLKVYLEAANIRRGDITALAPSPSAPLFPGSLPSGTDLIEVSVTINATYFRQPYHFSYAGWGAPLWRSTGLYAPPGKIITVTVGSPLAVNKSLSVQIGAHTDDLSKKAVWYRLPTIVNSFPVLQTSFKIGNPVGGLIFVRVPDQTNLGNVKFTFKNVVRAPYYKLGDDLVRWTTKVRKYPAPWAELDSGKLVIMVPSQAIRKLDDPNPTLKHWNKVLDSAAWLSNQNLNRPRAERFLVDADISAGWMHSGYPVMAYNTTGVWQEVLNITILKTKGAWGPYHELGHNHQWSEMVFSDGVIEASCNLFTVYALESTGVPLSSWENYGNVGPAGRAALRSTYLSQGAQFSTWGVFTALDTFLQLKEGFGWGFYRSLYANYQQKTYPLPEDKIQTWIQTTCNVSGYNLVPFYTKWGFPITQNSTTRCGSLPAWADDPMN